MWIKAKVSLSEDIAGALVKITDVTGATRSFVVDRAYVSVRMNAVYVQPLNRVPGLHGEQLVRIYEEGEKPTPLRVHGKLIV